MLLLISFVLSTLLAGIASGTNAPPSVYILRFFLFYFGLIFGSRLLLQPNGRSEWFYHGTLEETAHEKRTAFPHAE
ncbi:hypothetical protein AB1L30_14075 [Bremerella sp. JC817]|uniref:hypothetical protein n=1 Tax=Bremerella sp. JC817 TaxID=3231756 RepID=UPI0034597C93